MEAISTSIEVNEDYLSEQFKDCSDIVIRSFKLMDETQLSLTKFVSILNFVQNIDAFFIPLWLLGAFIKLSLCLFILSYGLSEWTGIQNWKFIAYVMAFILLIYVIYITHNLRLSFTLKSMFLISFFTPLSTLSFP
ncbi:hypothetical protein ASG89_15635 [Paenibacillus sp. Soil766]|uniref:GerAB/ArcD/ProY family transporter n=1 Tax=Paenibacillus sp. Soil766 TaxID=1736404 RepID=UPI000710FA8F|nr:GerAB/ArcD/ProY family transporter [Paenibacillus sp. Soil766]KRF09647.1 hypothetical protein ASG89_15635 [Paenibacillus sp. Soil766]